MSAFQPEAPREAFGDLLVLDVLRPDVLPHEFRLPRVEHHASALLHLLAQKRCVVAAETRHVDERLFVVARQAFAERQWGTISPGADAYLVLLDRDPRSTPEVAGVRVLETYLRGDRVYSAG